MQNFDWWYLQNDLCVAVQALYPLFDFDLDGDSGYLALIAALGPRK